MSQLTHPTLPVTAAASAAWTPTLHSGDRLDRQTFHERYLQTPEDFKAELVEGTVFVACPVSRRHGGPHGRLTLWLGTYHAATPGVDFGDNATVFLTPDYDEVQPDGLLFVLPDHGGQIRYAGDYYAGGPDLIVEIATSRVAIDLHAKRWSYERAGVREYVVLATEEPELFWHELRDGQLVRLDPPGDGVFRSAVFPGLWLDAAAVLADDAAGVLKSLQAGMADPAHAAFVAELAGRAKS